MRWPRYSSCCWANTHLDCLIQNWCSCMICNTCSRCCRWSSKELLYTSISSMNTSTCFLSTGAKILFMTLWNVAGAFVSPKGITRSSYNPLCVLNAVLNSSPWATRIWWYPDLKSCLVNQQAPASSSSNSSTTGRGCLFFYSKCIQMPVINTKTPRTVLLFDQDIRRSKWTATMCNDTWLKHRSNLKLNFSFLLWRISIWPHINRLCTRQ